MDGTLLPHHALDFFELLPLSFVACLTFPVFGFINILVLVQILAFRFFFAPFA